MRAAARRRRSAERRRFAERRRLARRQLFPGPQNANQADVDEILEQLDEVLAEPESSDESTVSIHSLF